MDALTSVPPARRVNAPAPAQFERQFNVPPLVTVNVPPVSNRREIAQVTATLAGTNKL